jgi:hypothetical protein
VLKEFLNIEKKVTNENLLYGPLWVNIGIGGISSMDNFFYGSFGGKNNTKPYKNCIHFFANIKQE